MGRKRLHENAAERQKAYRSRIQNLTAETLSSPKSTRASKKKASRPARLGAIQNEVRTLLGEYEDWLSQMPESLAGSGQADRLSATIEMLTEAADLLSSVEPPLGFGRD